MVVAAKPCYSAPPLLRSLVLFAMSRTTRKLNLKLKSQRKETPLPRGQVVAVLAVQLVEAFQVNIIFPFVVFMIRDFGVAEREEDVGRYAGAMAASFCLAQFASSFIWGYCSDGIGRKRCIVLGTSGVFLATVIFATSRSFTQALAGRILAGLLNGVHHPGFGHCISLALP